MQRRNILRGASILRTLVTLAILSGAAMASDITGNWSGTMSMGDNQFTLTYTFKQEGANLSGSVTTPSGDAIPLVEGKVDGDKVSFAVKVDMNGSPAKFVSSGTIKGEEIALMTKGDANHDFPETAMTLKRAH